jgi:hypothetical protein
MRILLGAAAGYLLYALIILVADLTGLGFSFPDTRWIRILGLLLMPPAAILVEGLLKGAYDNLDLTFWLISILWLVLVVLGAVLMVRYSPGVKEANKARLGTRGKAVRWVLAALGAVLLIQSLTAYSERRALGIAHGSRLPPSMVIAEQIKDGMTQDQVARIVRGYTWREQHLREDYEVYHYKFGILKWSPLCPNGGSVVVWYRPDGHVLFASVRD